MELAREILDREKNTPWHWLLMEGEVDPHENCQGPDCTCWTKEEPTSAK